MTITTSIITTIIFGKVREAFLKISKMAEQWQFIDHNAVIMTTRVAWLAYEARLSHVERIEIQLVNLSDSDKER